MYQVGQVDKSAAVHMHAHAAIRLGLVAMDLAIGHLGVPWVRSSALGLGLIYLLFFWPKRYVSVAEKYPDTLRTYKCDSVNHFNCNLV